MQENSSISQEAWRNLLIRYQNKHFVTDDYGIDYLILHNEKDEAVQKKLINFKYSKISLDGLIKRMEDVPQISRDYIDSVKEFYAKRKTIDVIPIHLSEIRDNLFDVNLLIEFCKKRDVDWEFISREDYERLNPKKKKFLNKKKAPVTDLFQMSEAALKVEAQMTLLRAEELEERVQTIIETIKNHDRVK